MAKHSAHEQNLHDPFLDVTTRLDVNTGHLEVDDQSITSKVPKH